MFADLLRIGELRRFHGARQQVGAVVERRGVGQRITLELGLVLVQELLALALRVDQRAALRAVGVQVVRDLRQRAVSDEQMPSPPNSGTVMPRPRI